MSLPIAQRINRTKTQLILKHPILGSLILKIVANPIDKKYLAQTGDSAVPFVIQINLAKMTIQYNAENLNQYSDTELEFILAHEAMHLLLGTLIRRQGRKPKKWNVATDFEINWMLKDMGFQISLDCLYDADFHKNYLIAEKIYDLLPDRDDDEEENMGDVEEPQTSEEEREAVINQQSATVSANQLLEDGGNVIGQIPDQMKLLLKSLTTSKIRWQDYFMNTISGMCRDDFSYRRCMPGYIPQNIYLPTLYSPTNKAIVIVDTSGSIGRKELELFVSEVKSMLWMFHVSFMSCDADIGEVVEEAKSIEEILEALTGGGGTEFAPAFNWIEDHVYEPVNVVLMTDGDNNDKHINRPVVVQNLITLTTTGRTPKGIESDIVLHIAPEEY